jgi:hypothetical protein
LGVVTFWSWAMSCSCLRMRCDSRSCPTQHQHQRPENSSEARKSITSWSDSCLQAVEKSWFPPPKGGEKSGMLSLGWHLQSAFPSRKMRFQRSGRGAEWHLLVCQVWRRCRLPCSPAHPVWEARRRARPFPECFSGICVGVDDGCRVQSLESRKRQQSGIQQGSSHCQKVFSALRRCPCHHLEPLRSYLSPLSLPWGLFETNHSFCYMYAYTFRCPHMRIPPYHGEHIVNGAS